MLIEQNESWTSSNSWDLVFDGYPWDSDFCDFNTDFCDIGRFTSLPCTYVDGISFTSVSAAVMSSKRSYYWDSDTDSWERSEIESYHQVCGPGCCFYRYHLYEVNDLNNDSMSTYTSDRGAAITYTNAWGHQRQLIALCN